MQDLVSEIRGLEAEARQALRGVRTEADLEAVRIRFLGRKEGRLTAVMRGLGALAAEERPAVGEAANRVKQALTDLLDAAELQLAALKDGAATQDLTLPGRRTWVGARHPVTLVIDDICRVLGRLGFTRARGPEAETDWYNFVSLNTPLDHPAADMHDTFYLADGKSLLRTHTSPIQIRYLESHRPPVKIIAPGRVYRRDYDATHSPMFHQVEGV